MITAMASIMERTRKNGSPSFTVRWRDPQTKRAQGITFDSRGEAETLKRLLETNGNSFEIAQHAIVQSSSTTPTVSAVVTEHIDQLIRPTKQTIHNYRTMLDRHIADVIGHIPADKVDHKHVTHWVRALMDKGLSPKTIRNVHGLLASAMETGVRYGYRGDNPCRGTALPSVEKVEDDAQFLTAGEFAMVHRQLDDQYKDLAAFLVLTGARYGEATAITVGDVDLMAKPPTVRITKAWKRDGSKGHYVGVTKTPNSKRTVSLPPTLVEMLIPLVASRPADELLFTGPQGGRVQHKLFWHHHWVPAVRRAQSEGLTKAPRIHDLRHTHASWLIQDGQSLFSVSRRLGHSSTDMTDRIYGHRMPDALQGSADASERALQGLRF